VAASGVGDEYGDGEVRGEIRGVNVKNPVYSSQGRLSPGCAEEDSRGGSARKTPIWTLWLPVLRVRKEKGSVESGQKAICFSLRSWRYTLGSGGSRKIPWGDPEGGRRTWRRS